MNLAKFIQKHLYWNLFLKFIKKETLEEFHEVHTKTSLLESIFKALLKKSFYQRCYLINFVKFS